MSMTSDEQAIANIVGEYAHLTDNKEFDAAGALWADDGTMEVFGRTYVGPARVARFLSKSYVGKHLNGSPSIWIDDTGTSATGRVGFAFWRASDLALFTVGRYEDEYRKTADGWRFTRRAIVMEYGPIES
ncbi:MAG: nuclear transport factor 2 family protein [Acidimicrobiia bacterium]